MRTLVTSILLLLLLALPALFNSIMLRHWQRNWWRRPLVKILIWSFPLGGALCLALILLVPLADIDPTATPLAQLMLMVLLGELVLMVAIPPTAGLQALLSRWPRPRRSHNDSTERRRGRRELLSRGLTALPVVAAGLGMGGVRETFAAARVDLRQLAIPELSAGLEGLRVLHVSDLHLGGFMLLSHLDGILAQARKLRPELIVITGDVADDLRLLPSVLDRFIRFGAPLGVYVTLGNHEYGNGVREARAILAESDATLLVNENRLVRRGGDYLQIAGVDDPLGCPQGMARGDYLVKSVQKATAGTTAAACRVLLSHRPEAFDHIPGTVALTLAGHTHGGQMGLAGRSALEWTGLSRYPWGLYRRGEGQLYTSAGAGQWFPYRLGCPSEAPVFELRRG